MVKSSKAVIETAAMKSDQYLESEAGSKEIARLHAQHLETGKVVLAATVEAYSKLFADRKEAISKIPAFWFAVLMKHPQLSLFLAAEKDQECLTYLEDITLVRGGDKKDLREYDLAFTFKENPFFTEKTLTKKFTVAPVDHSGHDHADGEGHDDEEAQTVGNVVTVSWKDDAHNLAKLSPRSVGEDDEDNVEPGSFFCLFSETEDPFNIGEVLRDEIVPNALEMFAGMADMDDDEDDFSDEDSEEEDLDPRPTKKSKA